MRACVPDWIEFAIRNHGKYLGFFVGPGAIDMEWKKIGEDILDISRTIKSMRLPKLHAFIMWQTLGESRLMYTAQLRNLPTWFRKVEKK